MPSSCDFPVSTKTSVKPVIFYPDKCPFTSTVSLASNYENTWPSDPAPCVYFDPDNEEHRKNYSTLIQSLTDRNINSLKRLQYILRPFGDHDKHADECRNNLRDIGIRKELLDHFGIFIGE